MIRPAKNDDLDEILKIERASFDDPWTREDLAAFTDHPAARFAVLDEGGVKGFVIYSLICGEAEVYDIAVDPSSRGRGYGRALLDEALREADAAFLDVRAGNVPALALYRSRGFVETGIRKKYYSDGEDAVVMNWSR